MFDRRIRDNDYELPADHVISTGVQDIIQDILTPFLLSDQLIMKSSTIYSSLEALFNLIFLLRLATPHQISVTFYKTTSDGNLRRLRKYALLDIDQNPFPPSGMPTSMSSGGLSASILPIALLHRRSSKKQYSLDHVSPLSSVRHISHYIWAWVRQGQASWCS
jgi:cell cycle serine/threonine-protein kinase CDC5/MSD2